jgi:1,5-anhydro-D-fructose reductase (1,5-anhydro-D-mannitol-forming)
VINVGIIGYGKMGQIRAEAIKASDKGRVVSVCDKSVAKSVSDEIAIADSPETMIDDPQIEAVFVCTPNYLNKPLTKLALNNGKHVFCEKPPAFTAAEVEDIQKAERSSGLTLMYGFNHRHHESIKKIKTLVYSKEMGKILWMRGRYGKEVDEDFFKGWRAKREFAGGGIMLDQGIHMLDLMIYLSGGFDEVQSMVSNLYWKADGVEDNVFVNLRSKKTGICASIHSTMTQWRYIFSLEVFLEGGSVILNGLKTSSGAYGDEQLTVKRNKSHSASATYESEVQEIYDRDTSWTSEVLHFLDAVEEGKPIELGNSNDALNVMRIIDKIYRQK